MSEFVVAAKIQFSVDGVITTLGVSSRAYFADASGLMNRTWYPILQSDVSVSVDLALPWDSGSPSQDIGDIVLVNGGDSEFEHVLDQLISAQVAGLGVEVKRGTTDQAWADLEQVFVSKTNGKRFDGESLILPQRSSLDILEQPIATQVFDETTPNPRIVNRTVPLLLGRSFQIEPLIFDAPNQVYYTAQNIGNITEVFEGGNVTTNWVPVEFGHQLTAGSNLTITVDAIGPPPDTVAETTLVDWTFDAWTSDDPDGITVFESTASPFSATISENVSTTTADVTVSAPPDADTGFVSFTAPELATAWGIPTSGDWVASSGTLADAIVVDDGTSASVTYIEAPRLRVTGVDPAVPAGSKITGVELEIIADGTNATWDAITVGNTSKTIAEFVRPGGGDFQSALPGTKTTLTGGGSNFKFDTTVTDEDVNSGIGVGIRLRQTLSGSTSTANIYQIRIKLHYAAAIETVRLYSGDVLTKGQRYGVEINTVDADIRARWAGVAASGDAIAASDDPFSTHAANLSGFGVRSFEFVAEGGFFGMEFERSTTAGAAEVNRIRVTSVTDGVSSYPGLLDYLGTLKGFADSIDTAAINAHDAAAGSPEIGWYVTGNESTAEWLDLVAGKSLSGAWWPDRDGMLRSMLWSLDPQSAPDFRIENITVDGRPQPIRVNGNITVQSDPAPRATERAVGARNWRPLRVSETAGITDTFSEQERANVIEEWRVRRRANFDALNPWTT